MVAKVQFIVSGRNTKNFLVVHKTTILDNSFQLRPYETGVHLIQNAFLYIFQRKYIS